MPFWIVFGFAAAVTGAGFVAVVALIVHRAIRAARDPEYRATIEALQARRMRAHDWSTSQLPPPVPSYDPATDPGNPASPMFPGDPGNPT